jgi:mRNA interferase RelE/StbE
VTYTVLLSARLLEGIRALRNDPRPPGCKALTGPLKGVLRIRQGDYRILYRVEDETKRVLVTAVTNRKDA